MTYAQTLNSIVNDIISPAAQTNDQKSSFPRAAINALGKAGFLGLISSKDVGGMGLGLKDAAFVVETVSKSCPSTGMILTMHYCATAVIEKYGNNILRKNIAEGRHLSTLAWSEVGSRSHFWAPVGNVKKNGNHFTISSQKSMVTSAGEADSYVWTSLPAEAEGAATMWLVERNNPGIAVAKAFDGMGLRGNASAPMYADHLQVDSSAMLGADGSGFDTMIGTVLPVFCTLSASCSLGIAESALGAAISHTSSSKLEHINTSLSSLQTIRSYLAQAKIKTDMARTLRDDTLTAIESNRADAMLRVMEVKASLSEIALEVTDTAMRVCGGAAFRKDLDLERFFRDARAAHIMAPTSDVLYDFIGKAICNMPVFG